MIEDCEPRSRQKDWFFGPDWPGQRCGARTRHGTPCQKPALSGKKLCQLHGGRAGAPSGERNGNFKSGRYTKEALKAHKDAMARLKALARLAKSIGMLQ
ncbi:MAG: HGGxSTG domain-containing protein [Pseudomonadota bacterium]|nr:HGGxSTG domain-containing protein [Pseudomonadota bacterium]